MIGVNHQGRHIAERHVADLTLTEVRYAPNTTISKHTHERACFCLVVSGSYDETFGHGSFCCTPSTVLFRPPYESHRDIFNGGGAKCLLIEVELEWLNRVREYTPMYNQPALLGGPPAQLALKILRHFAEPDNLSSLAIEGLALELAAEFAQNLKLPSQSRPPRWLREAREMISFSYKQPKTLRQIGSAVGVHPVHLAREFRRHYRDSVGGYIRQQRIDEACRELRKGVTPLAEIALSVGFSSQSHFARCFKAFTGVTPGAYRSCFVRSG